MAEELAGIDGVVVDPNEIETNIMWFSFEPRIMKRIKSDYFTFVGMLKEEGILCIPGFGNDSLRIVTHRDVSRADCEQFVRTIKKLIKA